MFEDQQDPGRRIDQDFSKEGYRFKAKIISSEYKEQVTALINQYDFSQSCKIQLMNIINVAFDPNAMLARNISVTPRKIELQIAMNLAIVAMDQSDVQNPGLLNVMNSIEQAFGDFVSRSEGGKMGDKVLINEESTHLNYSGLPSPGGEMQQPGRRGLRLPWGGDR